MTIKVWTFTLSEKDYDHRDYFLWNLFKNFDKLTPPNELMRGISETYYQKNLWACTSFATNHSVKSQNEKEYKRQIKLNERFLRAKMGHSLIKYDGWDSVEKAVKTALQYWIEWELDWEPYLFKSDLRWYGKRDSRKQALMILPLIVVIKWNNKTWEEMLDWEVKTIWKYKDWHAILLAWYDQNYVYFYNSFGDKINKNGISNFKMSKENFEKAISKTTSMINWRWFGLVDKKDLIDYAKQIELSKQIISPLKKLYDIWDQEIREYLEEIWLTKKLENKYWFTYTN